MVVPRYWDLDEMTEAEKEREDAIRHMEKVIEKLYVGQDR